MAGCSSCGGSTKIVNTPAPVEPYTAKSVEPYAGKSDTKELVKLRYMGGGYSKKSGHGCSSCGSSGSYHYVTSETLSFVSEDAPNGYFKNLFAVGHDYYVTEKQAEYLLSLTYQSRAGRKANKFERVG